MKKVTITFKPGTNAAYIKALGESGILNNAQLLDFINCIIGEIDSDKVKEDILKLDWVENVEDCPDRYLIQ